MTDQHITDIADLPDWVLNAQHVTCPACQDIMRTLRGHLRRVSSPLPSEAHVRASHANGPDYPPTLAGARKPA